MRISELVSILLAAKEYQGDAEVIGECDDCQTTDLDVFVLTDTKNLDSIVLQVGGWEG